MITFIYFQDLCIIGAIPPFHLYALMARAGKILYFNFALSQVDKFLLNLKL